MDIKAKLAEGVKKLTFAEVGHTYTVEGDTPYLSCSQFSKKWFKFYDDTKKDVVKMPDERNFDRERDEKTPEERKEEQEYAMSLGTELHKRIAAFYHCDDGDNSCITNGDFFNRYMSGLPEHDLDANDETAWRNFLRFVVANKHFEPVAIETPIIDTVNKIAGTPDALFRYQQDGNSHIVLVDWKRAKHVYYDSFLMAGDPAYVKPLAKSSINNYAIQTSVYRNILERCYGIPIHYSMVVRLHSNATNFECHVLPYYKDRVEPLMERNKPSF